MHDALRIHSFGSASQVLELACIDVNDSLSENELRLKILASPINPADLNWISGTYGITPMLPAIPGGEAVAEVIESRHADFTIGDRVMFWDHAHGWQEQRIIHGSRLRRISADVPLLQAAMLRVNPATAWQMLHALGTLPKGTWIAQNAANSGVGHCVIELAAFLGLRSLNFVRRSQSIDALYELGADAVFPDSDDGLASALEKLGSERAALACNAVGGDSASRLTKTLARHGLHLTYGAMSVRPVSIRNRSLIFDNIRFQGFWLKNWLDSASLPERESTYRTLETLMSEGMLHQPIDSQFPLSQFPRALERLQAPERAGKVLFCPHHRHSNE